jgi:dimethylsulfoniopropionate demethylase
VNAGAPLSISRRTRRTPYSDRVQAAGPTGYTVYNHMLLPTGFAGLEDDYWHLREAVQVWDVACERQVQLAGHDAMRLAQLLTVRDLSSLTIGRCMYAPVVDQYGRMINDPIITRVDDERVWVSIADSDVALWAGGLAAGMAMEVDVTEADVWPLALQGPLADDVAAAVFGDEVRQLGFFRWARFAFGGEHLLIARSGWSAQGGFEIYLEDASMGFYLWDAIVQAGEELDIRPGAPNLIERIEGGLLSYGNDMTREHSPLECGLDRFCSLDTVSLTPQTSLGIDAVRAEASLGVTRRIRGLVIDGDAITPPTEAWPLSVGDIAIGSVGSAVWSPRLSTNVAIAMVGRRWCASGTAVLVHTSDGVRDATVVDLPFPGGARR